MTNSEIEFLKNLTHQEANNLTGLNLVEEDYNQIQYIIEEFIIPNSGEYKNINDAIVDVLEYMSDIMKHSANGMSSLVRDMRINTVLEEDEDIGEIDEDDFFRDL